MPVRNEAWVLEHSLAALSAFCDFIIVNDQASDDRSVEVCRRFPKVAVIESREVRVCEAARWQLLDAARDYEGCNLWWFSDADELVSPLLAAAVLHRDRAPGTAVECDFYHSWHDVGRYRDDQSLYRPQRRQVALRDDRHIDFDRSPSLPLHQPRVPASERTAVEATNLPILHLQWLLTRRNQLKQAWYRCRELLNRDRTIAEINRRYAITLPERRIKTSPVPGEWLHGLSFPDFARVDAEPSWHEREMLEWFDHYGAALFEPLEIWHIRALRDRFVQLTGRSPRPDRSYRPSRAARARHLAARAVAAGRRRLAF